MKKLRYFLEYIAFALIILLIRLMSLDTASKAFGLLARHIGPKLRVSNVARQNLELSLPGITLAEREIIIRGMWENLGRIIGEFPHIADIPAQEFSTRVRLNGQERLQGFKHGVIFVSAHFGNWEILPRIGRDSGLPFALVYRAANNPYVDKLIQEIRRKSGLILYPKGRKGAIAIARALKSGANIGMLVDQKLNAGLALPFLGRTAMTSTAAAAFALKFNVPIVPVEIIRQNGFCFTVNIHSPLATEGKDEAAISLELNQIVESWIRRHPEQWFWLHRRWGK